MHVLHARAAVAMAVGSLTDGPEGWLGRTGLLPCHYTVQVTRLGEDLAERPG